MVAIPNMDSAKQYYMVNGAQLPNFMGQNISVVGIVTEAASSGCMSFTMKTTDNLVVPIYLKKPSLNNVKAGYVEVRGICEVTNEGKVIRAEEFFTFNNQKFDSKNHTLMCRTINSLPNIYSLKKP